MPGCRGDYPGREAVHGHASAAVRRVAEGREAYGEGRGAAGDHRQAEDHLALGNGYSVPVIENEIDKINRSSIHLDFMIGSPELTIIGTGDSGEVALMARGEWQI